MHGTSSACPQTAPVHRRTGGVLRFAGLFCAWLSLLVGGEGCTRSVQATIPEPRLSVVAVEAAGADTTASGALPKAMDRDIPLLSFTAQRVPQSVELLVADGKATFIGLEGGVPEDWSLVLHEPFPGDGDYRAVVRCIEGPALVEVCEATPTGGTVALRIQVTRDPDARRRRSSKVSFDVCAEPVQKAERPHNVLLITIDTLRADRLGCYGYSRPTSPNIDAFAEQAVLFSRAYTTSSFTPPAHASIMTSMYVHNHGLYTWEAMDDERQTLAEAMRDAGYRTAASTNLQLLTRENLGQGFGWQRDETETGGAGERDARDIVADALGFIRHQGGQPFLMWLHFYDVHRPYGGERSWARLFNPAGDLRIGGDQKHYCIEGRDVQGYGLTEKDLEWIEDRYDAGIAYVDSQIGPLLQELSTPEWVDNTIVAITADHGENLSEPRRMLFAHDPFLYTQVTRVPLIVRFPGRRHSGTVTDALVSLIDVAPTVLDEVGLAIPATFEGLSLAPLVDTGAWGREVIFMETWGEALLKAARTRDRFTVRDVVGGTREYFDTDKDPLESSPVFSSFDEGTAELDANLDRLAESPGWTAQAGPLDTETIAQLTALGYLE